jgi:hypothetical protein
MFIAAETQRLTFALRHRYGDQFIGETPRFLRRRGTKLTA